MEYASKENINKIYNEKYHDIMKRGPYCIVYNKENRPTFLKNISISPRCMKYIQPEEVPLINNIMKLFKNNITIQYSMDNLISVKDACKKFVMELVSPYKHTRVEDVMNDSSIDNVYEKNAKGLALAVGNIITQFLMLNIDVAKNVAVYSYARYNEYLEAQERADDDESDEDEGNEDESNDGSGDAEEEKSEDECSQESDGDSEVNKSVCDYCDACEKDDCDDCECKNEDDKDDMEPEL